MPTDGYAWWKERLRASFEMYDVVRIDHFRGFDAYWRIPFPRKTRGPGEWRPGPGLDFFRAVKEAFPDAKIIAEDLGLLTPSVEELLERHRPSGDGGPPVRIRRRREEPLPAAQPAARTASSTRAPTTTTRRSAGTRRRASRCATTCGATCASAGTRSAGTSSATAYSAVSRIAVVPMQDLLSLGSEARFNSPGKPEGNWRWRLADGRPRAANHRRHRRLPCGLADLYGRAPGRSRPTRQLNPGLSGLAVARDHRMFADLIRLIYRRPPVDYERGFVRERHRQRPRPAEPARRAGAS